MNRQSFVRSIAQQSYGHNNLGRRMNSTHQGYYGPNNLDSGMNRESVVQQGYDGAASLGRGMAIIGAFFATLIGIFLIIAGRYIVVNRADLIKIQGIVLSDSSCNETNQTKNADAEIHCNTNVGYTVNNIQYEKFLSSGSNKFKKDSKISVYYDKDDHNSAELNPVPKFVGYILFAVAFILIVFSWLWVLMTRTYKVAAAAGGINTAADIIF